MTEFTKFILESLRTITFGGFGLLVAWLLVEKWKDSREHHGAVRQTKLELRAEAIDDFALASHAYTAAVYDVSKDECSRAEYDNYQGKAFDGYSIQLHQVAVYFGIDSQGGVKRWFALKQEKEDVQALLDEAACFRVNDQLPLDMIHAWLEAYARNDLLNDKIKSLIAHKGLALVLEKLPSIEKELAAIEKLNSTGEELDANQKKFEKQATSDWKSVLELIEKSVGSTKPENVESHYYEAAKKRLLKADGPLVGKTPSIATLRKAVETLQAEYKKEIPDEADYFKTERRKLRDLHHRLIQECVEFLRLDDTTDPQTSKDWVIVLVAVILIIGIWCPGLWISRRSLRSVKAANGSDDTNE